MVHNAEAVQRPAALPGAVELDPGLPHRAQVLRTADLCAKSVLAGLLVLVLVNPQYGNLEGKAPLGRAITYPMLALALPLAWRAFGHDRRAPFPWGADLALTLVCFSDVLGNRLDLYDRVAVLDDYMHLQNTALVAGAVASVTLGATATFGSILERCLVVGLVSSLAWELFVYFSFMTHSSEMPTAYGDTLADLTLGALGAGIAAVVVHHHRRAASGLATVPTSSRTGAAESMVHRP